MLANQHVFQDGQVGKQADVLEGARDPESITRCGGKPARSSTVERIVPLSAGVRPVTALNSVDLPDPFGPMTATTRLAGTLSVDRIQRDQAAVTDGNAR